MSLVHPQTHSDNMYRDSLDLAFRLHLFDGSPSAIPLFRLDDPATHPRRCLDLGCGSGEWIIAAAKLWPHTTFVGLDLVPPQLSLVDATSLSNQATLQPTNPTNLGSHPTLGASTSLPASGQHRVQWVQANFLRTLPFYAGEFDYIRLSGIARGVPEDKVCPLPIFHQWRQYLTTLRIVGQPLIRNLSCIGGQWAPRDRRGRCNLSNLALSRPDAVIRPCVQSPSVRDAGSHQFVQDRD